MNADPSIVVESEPYLLTPKSFSVILADPPWAFRDKGTRMHPSYEGRQRKQAHYSTMSEEQISNIADVVDTYASDDALLFLWAPNAMVLEGAATSVARLWGFEPKQLIPWLKVDKSGKPRLGGGHYTRVCTEQLVLATRGRPEILDHGVAGFIPGRRGKHSAKPDEAYKLIEALSAGPYLELFARRRWNEKWAVVGNEIGAKVTL